MIQKIIEYYPEYTFLTADGFDDAIIGVCEQMNEPPKIIYSVSKCLDILVKRDGMTSIDAMEYFEFNVSGAYVGDQTPIWCHDTILNE